MGELQPGSRRYEEREWLRKQLPEWWEDVFDRIACGEKPSEVIKPYCVRFAMFGRVLEEDLARKAEYEAALRIAADGMALETLVIADDGSNDTYVDENGNKRTDTDVIARSKLRVDARMKIAARLNRDRWGESIRVEKTVKVEADAGLLIGMGELLARLAAPKELNRVVATIPQEPEREIQAV